MVGIFTVTPSDLARLDATRAVDVFRALLWAEASAVGVAFSLISVPSAITVGDGGVDAQVDAQPARVGQGIIVRGVNRYQIKSGDFSLADSSLRDLLGRFSNKDELNRRIKSCLDANGRFVVVLIGCDNPDRTDDEYRNALVKYVQDKWGYTNPNIVVWRQNQICGFCSYYPSLALEIKGLDTAQFERHRTWASHTDMRVPFVGGPEQDALISEVRDSLRSDSSPVHVHLFGEPGIGKTRLALEATNAHDISPLVLYFDSPRKLSDSGLISEITREDNRYQCVIVVDECSQTDSVSIWNKLRAYGHRVKLITIFSDSTILGGDTLFKAAPLLHEDQIKGILGQYGLESIDAGRLADFCSGSPRVAHMLGRNLRNNPEDILREPDNVQVWDRYLLGGDDPRSPEVVRRQVILRCISLFRKFGYSAEFRDHVSSVGSKIKEIEPAITDAQIAEAIAELRRRHILQGDNVLYITPKLLHLYLFADWFRKYWATYDHSAFVDQLPQDLIDWHREMFQYAGDQPEIARLIQNLLSSAGAFPNIAELDSSSGSRFFFALTNANPEAALACLEKVLANVDHARLTRFKDGRRYVVWSLERIVIWKDLFERGAAILKDLAIAETETVANNATGVFADLYSPGYGRLAPTELPPLDRLPLLKNMIESGQSTEVSIALKACDRALETQGITRTVGPEYQGLRRTPEFWTPKTWGELYEYYKAVWELVESSLVSLEPQNSKEAIRVLLRRARGFSQIEHLAPIIQKTIESLADSDKVEKEELLKVIARILKYDRDGLPPDVVSKWEEIRDGIVGTDFKSLLKRYVGMNIFEDHIDEGGNRTDLCREKIRTLAKEAVKDPTLLDSEFAWLMTEKAVRGAEFGFDLGTIDDDHSLLPLLIEKQKNGDNRAFLGGYFAALFNDDEDIWEATLDELAGNGDAVKWVPELTWRSGITDKAAKRILHLAESDRISANDLEPFSRGGIAKKIDESIFIDWLKYLLATGTRSAIAIGLQLHHYYYAYPRPVKTMPVEVTLDLLLHDSLFDVDRSDEWVSPLVDDIWEWTALSLLDQNEDIGIEIAEKYISHFGLEGTIIGGYHSSSQRVINILAQRYPTEVWNMVTRELGPPATEVAFNISHWLRGGEFYPDPNGALYFFPKETVFGWVDEDKDTRGPYLASFVPPRLVSDDGRTNLAREMLVRYGDAKRVRNEFHANYGSEGWVGPGSIHFQRKKESLEKLKSSDTNSNVRKWLDEEIESLDYMIRREQIEEEQRGF